MSELALKLIAKAKRTRATRLDLGNCGLTELPDELFELTWLEELILSSRWIEYSFEKKEWEHFFSQNKRKANNIKHLSPKINILRGLKKLIVSGWNEKWDLSDLSPLKDLTALQQLSIFDTQVSNLNPLTNLTALQQFNVNTTQVSDLSPLTNLTALRQLDISNTKVSDLSPLTNLTTLQLLDLNSTQVNDLSPLSNLIVLQQLEAFNTQVNDLSPLTNLTALQLLDVSYTQVDDLSPLTNLTALQKLYIFGTQVNNLSSLAKLTALQQLYVFDTQVNNLSPLAKLTALQKLYIFNTQVNDLSPLTNLTALQELYVNNTQVSDLSPLKGIIEKGVAVEWAEFEDGIMVKNCPLTNPPKEIVTQGNAAILSYWQSLEEAQIEEIELMPINEIKILLVGEGMAGKTSLLKRIKGLDFDKNESQTHGIIIEKLPFTSLPLFKTHDILRGVTGRFWDFGGQEIMHASHQFFLSNRSIYVLLVDSRTDDKKEMWLKHIQKFGGNSPAIVAITKFDDNRSYDVERMSLNSKFPFIGNRFHRISSKTGENLNDLAKEIADLIPQTEIFKTQFHPDWVAVKEQLEAETAANKYIDQAGFERICIKNRVTDKTAQKTLLNYLDSLGIALHSEKLDLQNFYVLDPHWVTIGVYKIINSQVIIDGLFKENQLDYILNHEVVKKEEYDPAKEKTVTYSPDEQRYLVKIMQQFGLLYLYNEAEGTYLVPDLLPKEPKTGFSFDEKETTHIRFVIKYDFLPPSFMARFIIRMKSDIHNLNHLWRTGVELYNRPTKAKAIVKADKSEKRIDICISGSNTNKRAYFSIIRNALWEIKESFKDLEAKEFMPVPDHPTIEIEYEELLGYERANKDEYFIGKLGKSYSVSKDFLDKISTKEERMQEEKKKWGDTYNYFDMKGATVANVAGSTEKQESINIIQNNGLKDEDTALLKELLAKLSDDKKEGLKTFVETLPEPEDEDDKQTYGKQIIKWLNKNAEGIVGNVAASVYYDALKGLLGIG